MNQESNWANFRMPTWEDDISLNHDSTTPFNNFPSPSEMPIEEFKANDVLTPDLLGDTPLEDFVKRDTFPIPDASDREGYNPNFNARFFMTGLADFLKIKQVAKEYELDLNSYLDFGCASGRVLRHFCAQSEIPNLWGSDINGRHIRWLNDYMPPRLKLVHNNCIPQLPIADHSFDLVSAFSVFTHIDTFETAWLAELYRVLKPGGLCYLTVHNEDTWSLLQEADDNNGLLKRFRDVDPEFDELLKHNIPQERKCFRYTDVGPYRALVVHSNAYLQKTWGRFFDILEIRGKHHGYMQSVLIGRKKS
ncbi:MAG: class I SAM-dependent methyltransferase [Mariniblastus sp.]|nr:class I SAM-dependent methyltransferase [Mariniblastus sp.]MDG2183189.1 class I SAM-dependent methyltransferase [Mariniblastus sp.]